MPSDMEAAGTPPEGNAIPGLKEGQVTLDDIRKAEEGPPNPNASYDRSFGHWAPPPYFDQTRAPYLPASSQPYDPAGDGVHGTPLAAGTVQVGEDAARPYNPSQAADAAISLANALSAPGSATSLLGYAAQPSPTGYIPMHEYVPGVWHGQSVTDVFNPVVQSNERVTQSVTEDQNSRTLEVVTKADGWDYTTVSTTTISTSSGSYTVSTTAKTTTDDGLTVSSSDMVTSSLSGGEVTTTRTQALTETSGVTTTQTTTQKSDGTLHGTSQRVDVSGNVLSRSAREQDAAGNSSTTTVTTDNSGNSTITTRTTDASGNGTEHTTVTDADGNIISDSTQDVSDGGSGGAGGSGGSHGNDVGFDSIRPDSDDFNFDPGSSGDETGGSDFDPSSSGGFDPGSGGGETGGSDFDPSSGGSFDPSSGGGEGTGGEG
jgi:hypothetical protein